MKSLILVAACLLVSSIPHPASAYSCHPSANSLGTVTLGTGEPDSLTYYVDDMGRIDGEPLVVYQEANGLAGLQRGGMSAIIPDDYTVCTEDEKTVPDVFLVSFL